LTNAFSRVAPHVVHRNTNDPSNFFAYEKYESMDALKTHSSTPHLQEFPHAVASVVAAHYETLINPILFSPEVLSVYLNSKPGLSQLPILDKKHGLSLVF